MTDLIQINEQRAEFYWWMSSLFAHELDEKDLDNYLGAQMASYFTMLAQTPSLEKEVKAFREALSRQQIRQNAKLELAADFCSLFLTTSEDGALPYASIYIGEAKLLNDKPARLVEKWLARFSIAQNKNFNEPADHISVILDFFANMIILSNALTDETAQENAFKDQLDFLDQCLLSWLDLFVAKINTHDDFGFYQSAANLLSSFVKLDHLFIKGE